MYSQIRLLLRRFTGYWQLEFDTYIKVTLVSVKGVRCRKKVSELILMCLIIYSKTVIIFRQLSNINTIKEELAFPRKLNYIDADVRLLFHAPNQSYTSKSFHYRPRTCLTIVVNDCMPVYRQIFHFIASAPSELLLMWILSFALSFASFHTSFADSKYGKFNALK